MKLTEISIFTDSVIEAAAFYEKLLGRPPVHQEEGFAMFQFDGQEIVIHKNMPEQKGGAPHQSHAGFSVADLDTAVRDLKANGVVIQYPPKKYPWGRSAYLRDPSGNLIELKDARQGG
jgi:predicted enzyme related to lactoylglutathione lyase